MSLSHSARDSSAGNVDLALAHAWRAPLAGAEVFEFLLGIALVAGLFWLLYHLESDWPQRLVQDPAFRAEAGAIALALALAYYLSPLFI